MGRKGTMMEREIQSKYLDESLTVKIYRPENFSPLYKYHLCIVQDGNDYFQMGRLATFSDELHENGDIENTIFAGIHYKDRYDRREKYHPDGKKQDAYMKFLRFEVVPMLDEELPGYYLSGSRSLMGDSLGGTISLMTALKYPNTFGRVIMQSPYVDETVLHAVKESKDVSSMSIYHTIGTRETDVPTTDGQRMDFLEPNRKLNRLLQEKTNDYTYHELDGNHTWKYWQKDLKHALIKIFG
ncbi:enterochelin esterase-like enzyme [Melghiribacillus thermohalophilus]|uniref:Enterochelin esterase-like enzyme n=1 Tax=Melghiribacillus thermohalophilus TaxID=1324956 RepID=A0A4R3N0S2_9BACI|nr:alpha/beta hydrolase-fold protein [Melghiribacillus thermohalophilus]TCT22385.1 enterochelin esterase-like enzyme [Melghiribacillus thermohalophilus]